MKNIFPTMLLLICVFSLFSCTKEDVCTACTESTTDITSDFCDTEKAVELFESELIERGGEVGQDWSCVRK